MRSCFRGTSSYIGYWKRINFWFKYISRFINCFAFWLFCIKL